MTIVPQYVITETIYTSEHSVVHRGRRTSDDKPVIIKQLAGEHPSIEEIVRLKYEYAINKDLTAPGVVRAYGLEVVDGSLSIILEDAGRTSLYQLIESKRLGLDDKLQVAIAVAEALGHIHKSHVVHMDIKPHNIMVSLDPLQVKVTDFGTAMRLTKDARGPEAVEATFAYMSPEQTGRMNRLIDSRTDLYSFGVTLYELLAGVLPFQTTDTAELFHSHIARVPDPPREVAPEVPAILSDIVMRLLSKMPEDRYQTAAGLKADLAECLAQIERAGTVEPFELARLDRPERLRPPQKLYGRDNDLATLTATWERASDGGMALVLVSGYAGIGKSVFVNELQKTIIGRRGHFITGKFDQLNRSTPYSAITTAFRGLIKQLLTERDDVLARWKARIQAAVGANGRLIIDLLPEVELILGPQPPVPEVSPSEAQARFGLVFQSFGRSLASAEHPLVIFLDDLQWADPASLKILQLLLTDSAAGYLMVIGSFRDNEIDAGHILWRVTDEIKAAKIPVDEIKLGPLDPASVTLLIADTLGSSAEHAAPLSQLVYEKTRGNPFFLGQFLETIYQEGLIWLDEAKGSWAWDVKRIRDAMVTDNVADLIGKKFHALSADAQRALKIAACIGHQFDFNTLALASEMSPKAIAAAISDALKEGLIVPLSAEYRFLQGEVDDGDIDVTPFDLAYRFLHDRIQQVADAALDEDEKRRTHLRIGRFMRADLAHERRDEALFDIVGHLRAAGALITDPEERLDFARLALKAGKHAKAATAHQAAAGYLELGAAWLGDAGWEREPDLAFALHFERAECELLAGQPEATGALLDAILPRAKSRDELAKIHLLRGVRFFMQGRGRDAVIAGAAGIKLFGIDVPDVDDMGAQQAALGAELAAVPGNLAGRRIEDLVNAEPMTDPDTRTALSLLNDFTQGTVLVSPFLLLFTIVKQVNISLKYGPSEDSAYGYVAYGFVLASAMGQPADGNAYGKLGLALNEKFNNAKQACKVIQLYSAYAHFFIPMRETLVLVEKAYAAGMESGDLVTIPQACSEIFMHRLGAGDELSALREEADRLLVLVHRLKAQIAIDFIKIGKQFGLALQGMTREPCSLTDGAFNEEEFKKYLVDVQMLYPLCWYYTLKLELFYLYGRHAEALAMAAEAEKLVTPFLGFYFTTELVFYKCLTLAALYRSATREEQQSYLATLTTEVAKLASWAETSPDNYRPKHLLVLAEQARISTKDSMAMELYGRAIASARDNGAVPVEALASELFARFYSERDNAKAARGVISQAYNAYVRWGAAAKGEELRETYPAVLQVSEASGPASTRAQAPTRRGITSKLGRKATEMMSMELLDVGAVIRTAQTMAGEVELNKVLDRFMRIVIENAGAQTGSLVLAREQGLFVEVQVSVASDTISVGMDSPLESAMDLPASIIKYVARTTEAVVIADAVRDERFMNDPYVVATRPKSILCLAMTHQGRLIGVLYLENNVTRDAFTQARLELLNLLSSMSAIAVENARLYSYVQHRTEELREMEERLALELRERERAEAARAALQEEIIGVQNARLAEMSTPIIPITDRIMVMPLIGTMDRQRAQQVLSTALSGVQSHRAEVVIIDITGVKLVDIDVASTLIGTAGALRLLGAQAVITGIRPDVAQTLIRLDVDFGAIVTKGTLQSGIAYALGRTGEARRLGLAESGR